MSQVHTTSSRIKAGLKASPWGSDAEARHYLVNVSVAVFLTVKAMTDKVTGVVAVTVDVLILKLKLAEPAGTTTVDEVDARFGFAMN